ncbi:MAG: hypothetical protein M1457_08870, partial [bacterium]|nr:hypothetical protein [bacterium]
RPEQSMQEVVWTETEVAGPKHFEGVLPRPHARANYYRDIAVLALPDAGSYRIPDFERKAAFQTHGRQKPASPSTSPIMIEPSRISDLTARMADDGRITWDVPAGKWTILRLGHTTTGVQNAPAPASGRGLECDKLSRARVKDRLAALQACLALPDDGALVPVSSRTGEGIADLLGVLHAALTSPPPAGEKS